MFKEINLKPENKTFAEIMGNSKSYIIPRFQRDYSWKEEQLNELWQDIEQMPTNETQHFMGYLVFKKSDNNPYEVIDGQQRLTTINLYILAALACFQEKADKDEDKNDNEQRIEIYRTAYIGFLDTVTLGTKSRLILNRNNQDHFKTIIEKFGVPLKSNTISATNDNLNKGFEFFKKKLDALKLSGKALAQHIDDVTNGLAFITISVEDDLNAYLVFETLNARGVQLSAPDLLKNYLLSTVARDVNYNDSHFDDFDKRWAEILKQLSVSNFTDFLRSHVGISQTLPSKTNLYRTLKKTITKSEQVFNHLKEIEKNAPIYALIRDERGRFWDSLDDGKYHEAKPYLETLRLFNIKTPMSLLMSAFNTYRDNPADFIKILQWITTITIRYNGIGQKQTNEQESLYNKIANDLYNNPKLKPNDIKPRLKQVYPSDAEFESTFRTKQMPSRQTNKKIIFLLSQIETQANDGKAPPLKITLEHILPYNPSDEWKEYFGLETYADAINRLGNLTIVSGKNMGQEPFDEKREFLAKRDFAVNRKIATYDKWDIAALDDYQSWLAKKAKSIWKINGL